MWVYRDGSRVQSFVHTAISSILISVLNTLSQNEVEVTIVQGLLLLQSVSVLLHAAGTTFK